MGFFKAISSIFDSNARVEQNLENYFGTFSSRSNSNEPPCVTLYDTFQLLGIGIHQWFKSPPVANNICALYSCITPPHCAKAFAHQLNLTGEPQEYKNPHTAFGSEFKKLLSEITEDGQLLWEDELEDKFVKQNGTDYVVHPRKPIEFSISRTTLSIFYEWNKEGLISSYMS
jgi:hypothetical protein